MKYDDIVGFLKRQAEFCHDRQLVFKLESDEIPLAVIQPRSDANKETLNALALSIESWQSSKPAVKRILGLENMLGGDFPMVSTGLLGIPMSAGDPSTWVEHVALVTLKRDGTLVKGAPAFQNTLFNVECRDDFCESLLKSLEAAVQENRPVVATVYFYEMYSYMNR